MNNVYKVDYFGKLIAFYLTGISIFYTFYYSAVNIDKNVGILIFIGAFLLMVFKKNSLQLLCKNTLDSAPVTLTAAFAKLRFFTCTSKSSTNSHH